MSELKTFQITFELPDDAPLFGGANVECSLHEALCQAIHEDKEAALDWLSDYVTDIQLTSPKGV